MLFTILIMIVCMESTIANMVQPNSYASLDFRIIEGDEAKLGQFPWYAFLHIIKENKWYTCGGTLIKNEWVLTAAHCIKDRHFAIIHLGIVKRDKAKFITHSRRFHTHPKFDRKFPDNDIALILLAASAPKSNLIKPISLPPSTKSFVHPGDFTETCGFGLSNFDEQLYPDNLLWLKVCIKTDDVCNTAFGPGDKLRECKMCGEAKNPKQNICSGDSGGGLIVRKNGENYIVGINSFVKSKECIGAPAVYERVSFHMLWINQIINS